MAIKKATPRKSKSAKASPDKRAPLALTGQTTKDSQYLHRIIRAIADERNHPRHQGVAMQAHHVISATAMKESGLADKIRKFGYDINLLDNLVFLPSTLQGACHLGVQPHRGNHTAPILDSYDDDEHPLSYHKMVAKRIMAAKLGLTKDCPGYMGGPQDLTARHKIKSELDNLSQQILKLIQKRPEEAPLTRVAAHFQPGDSIGCAGTDSTTLHRFDHQCSVGRNHHKNQGPEQKVENITYASDGKYQLKAGR
ncbi:AHH domain-containing protein [Uliginosibacterium sp. TH139]|uniref:AHH domain-containing protein n=1 Tax=Uliginosibacterium sp. TH139 TaxID=2067453 RepID=UPI000C79A6C6|nr:AHH domain-containing protein [Uliginosibacterium sp. TH139]PLK46934.1 hypothetical protein C0V76_19340 [Uliginosibacterium sp. TH139]